MHGLAAYQRGFAEAWAQRVYPTLARALGALTGWTAFSIAEFVCLGLVLIVALSLIHSVGLWLRGTRTIRSLVWRGLLNTLTIIGLVYAGYVTWGINYHRTPVADSRGLTLSQAGSDELRALTTELARRANSERRHLVEDDDGIARLSGSLGEVLRHGALGYERASRSGEQAARGYSGRAKGLSFFSRGLSNLGTSGVFVMLTGEPTVNVDLPEPALPFVICHELAHQVGWAREEEANFVGYLACIDHPDPDFRYSTALAALQYALAALGRVDPQAASEVRAALDPGVRRDDDAERDFWAAFRSPLTHVVGRAYDAYLRSQGQQAGRASYGRIVDLLLAERARVLRAAGS